jgi:hypothetical protein
MVEMRRKPISVYYNLTVMPALIAMHCCIGLLIFKYSYIGIIRKCKTRNALAYTVTKFPHICRSSATPEAMTQVC